MVEEKKHLLFCLSLQPLGTWIITEWSLHFLYIYFYINVNEDLSWVQDIENTVKNTFSAYKPSVDVSHYIKASFQWLFSILLAVYILYVFCGKKAKNQPKASNRETSDWFSVLLLASPHAVLHKTGLMLYISALSWFSTMGVPPFTLTQQSVSFLLGGETVFLCLTDRTDNSWATVINGSEFHL